MNWKILALGIPLAAALVACPPPPVTPSYTLAIDPATLTFNKPTTAVQIVNLTITPKDGFSSDLTAKLIPASGTTAPGITATDVTIPANASTAQLGVAITSAATDGTFAFLVQTSGGGLDPQTQALSITVKTVVTPPTPNFAVTATVPAAVTLPGPKTTTSTVTVTPSNGFTGVVTLSAANTSAAGLGVTYVFNPATVSVTSAAAVTSTLTIKVDSTVAAPPPTTVTTTAVTVTGTGPSSTVRNAPAVNLVINPAPAPTVADNILLTVPAGFTGKLATNAAPVLFTAQARNGTTVLASQPTFTWESSDPAVVVDASGNVTAKKFASNVTIKAKAGGLTSNVGTISLTYGLEASVGTYGYPVGQTGFAMVTKARDVSGADVDQSTVSYTIAGPAAWSATALSVANSEVRVGTGGLLAIVRSPPAGIGDPSSGSVPTTVAGDYTITATINAQTYSAKATVTNATPSFPAVTITSAVISQASGDGSVTWNPIGTAGSYRVIVARSGAGGNPTPTNTTATTATFSVATLGATETVSVTVVAYPVNVLANTVSVLPPQFDISSATSDVTVNP